MQTQADETDAGVELVVDASYGFKAYHNGFGGITIEQEDGPDGKALIALNAAETHQLFVWLRGDE